MSNFNSDNTENSNSMANKEIDYYKSEHTRLASHGQNLDNTFLSKTIILIAGMLIAFINTYQGGRLNYFAAIAMPFLLEYYGYNTVKHTAKTQELNGSLMAIENHLNSLLGKVIFIEYCKLKNEKSHWSGFWGAGIQIVFITPIGIISVYNFIEAIIIMDINIGIGLILFSFLILGAIVILKMRSLALRIKKEAHDTYVKWINDI
jgi:hypothetical protein